MISRRSAGGSFVFSYLVPYEVLGRLIQQVDPRLQPEFMERLRVEIHCEVTRELGRRAGVMVPVGLRSDAIGSVNNSQGILFFADETPKASRSLHGTMVRHRPGVGPIARTVGDHVYPSAAAGNLFRFATEKVAMSAGPLVDEYAQRGEAIA
jgi:hypothetical protein